MNTGKKYQKPAMRDLNDLTPALGLCSTGKSDGGCTTGTLAGGGQGCSTGNTAVGPSCAAGNGIYGAGVSCVTGSNV